MGHTFRRALPVLLVVALLGVIIGRPGVAPPVHATGGAAFSKVLPARLLAGDISHGLPANADASPPLRRPLNGYCVSGATAIATGPALGFTVTPGAQLDPNVAIPPHATNWIVDVKYFDPGTPGNPTDDTYCVVISAPIGAVDLTLSWKSNDGSATAALVIPEVTVTLRGINGVVGGAGIICTVGWDRTFLTGHASNLAGTLPDPLNQVATADWVLSPVVGTLTILGNPYPDPDPTHPGEWCISVGSTVAQANVNVQFSFDSVYDRSTNADDRPQPGDGTQARHVISLTTSIQFDLVNYSELRFAAPNGQLLPFQKSPLMIIGSTAVACIIPSDSLDVFSPNAINFDNGNGPDIPNSGNVRVFHAGAPGEAFMPGVVPGTFCFSWISTQPGEQSITLSFWKHDPVPPLASTTLAAQILLATDTTMTVVSSAGFTVGQPVRIDSEVVIITGIAGNTITIQRGASGTIAPIGPPSHLAGAAVTGHGIRQVSWDSNGDGNGNPQLRNGPLVARWAKIQSTVLTQGREEAKNIVTNLVVPMPVDFNAFDGSFLPGGDTNLTEWVYGVERTGVRSVIEVAQGAIIHARIDGPCGRFSASGTQVANGVSIGGRLDLFTVTSPAGDGLPDDIDWSITNDTNCNLNSTVNIHVDVFVPNNLAVPATGSETVTFKLQFTQPQSTPIVAWAGQTVTITYAFGYLGTCGLTGRPAFFNRYAGQPGSFVPGPGVTVNGAGSAQSNFDNNCQATVQYSSPDPGEVDIVATTSGRNFSKVVFPIFFMELEDLKLAATAQSVVSTPGTLSGVVRGWFVGTNPSPRAQETKPDGRVLPAKRWIIPDDWEQLRGFADARTNWPGAPDMPTLAVTFGMANESIVNSYADKVSNGDAGWMAPDRGGEFAWNYDPVTLVWAKLTPIAFIPDSPRPPFPSIEHAPITQIPPARILSDYTDTSGIVSVTTFGDFNLSYEGCPPNRLTTTPHPECDKKQVVGHSNYQAWTNLPGALGKHPPVRSATATTEWIWGGYKKLEVIDTASPVLKYLVVHLKDRDGFCDGAFFNNVLGLPIEFLILGRGDGKIAAMGGSNAVLNSDRQSATVTTFDTVDFLGQPLHADITLPTLEDGECQAWIKVSQSLPEPLRVRVTIPATPAPVPGPIRITRVVCFKPLDESVTIKNTGNLPVSLEGFSIRSDPDKYLDAEEYMEPTGILLPGESRTYPTNNWLNLKRQDNGVFREPGELPFPDYARLMWGGTEVSRAWCDGRFDNPDPLPAIVPSGEGDLTFEVVLPFGEQAQIQLLEGWNLVSATDGLDIATLVKAHESQLAAVYSWDENGNWLQYIVNGPANVNTLTRVESGKSMWLQVKQPFTLSMFK